MTRLAVGLALLAGIALFDTTSVLAQRVAVGVSAGRPYGVRASVSYTSPSAYLRVGSRYCEPEGRYLYCWDERAFRAHAPVPIHVFRRQLDRRRYQQQRVARRQLRKVQRRAYEFHAKAARRAWNRRHQQRYVRVVRGGRVIRDYPLVNFRLSLHI
jgi:hypothetical protein